MLATINLYFSESAVMLWELFPEACEKYLILDAALLDSAKSEYHHPLILLCNLQENITQTSNF